MIGPYLDCPNVDQHRSREDSDCMKSQTNQQLDNWKAKTLSAAGKIVLIKSNLIVDIKVDDMTILLWLIHLLKKKKN